LKPWGIWLRAQGSGLRARINKKPAEAGLITDHFRFCRWWSRSFVFIIVRFKGSMA